VTFWLGDVAETTDSRAVAKKAPRLVLAAGMRTAYHTNGFLNELAPPRPCQNSPF
jgi:hypothetical protein